MSGWAKKVGGLSGLKGRNARAIIARGRSEGLGAGVLRSFEGVPRLFRLVHPGQSGGRLPNQAKSFRCLAKLSYPAKNPVQSRGCPGCCRLRPLGPLGPPGNGPCASVRRDLLPLLRAYLCATPSEIYRALSDVPPPTH